MATFTNRATLTYSGGTTDSNIVTGTYLETLAVTKTALAANYNDGTRVTYVVSLVNSGAAPFTGLNVTDDLGANTVLPGGTTVYPLDYVADSARFYVNGVLQPNPTATSTQPLVFDNLTIPAGSNGLLLYTADVNPFANPQAGGTITNTATVDGAGLPEALTAAQVLNAAAEPNLSITKALSPTAVPENGTVTYTFVIQNTGNTAAETTDNVTITDVFDPILDITSVTLDGVALTDPTDYTYTEGTGTFSTVPGRITVPAATYQQQADGSYVTLPGEATLVVTGTI